MLLNCIGNYLNLFDLCGFNSGITKISSTLRCVCAIFSIQILMAIVFLYMKILLFRYFCETRGFIEAINELIEYSGSVYTFILIICDSFLHRHTQKRFWQFIQHLETNAYPIGTFSFRSYKIKFIEFFTCSISGLIYRLLPSSAIIGYQRLHVYCGYMIPVRLCQIRIFYYILCMDIVHLQLKYIKHELHTIDKELLKLKQIRDHFQYVHKTVNLLNTMFGWSQVALVACCFFSVFTDLNYAYILFLSNITIEADMFWLGHEILLIIYLFWSANNCSVTVSRSLAVCVCEAICREF